MRIEENKKPDDKNELCKQCYHPLNSHIVVAYDTSDFSKDGEMRCPILHCTCFHIISFNLKK